MFSKHIPSQSNHNFSQFPLLVYRYPLSYHSLLETKITSRLIIIDFFFHVTVRLAGGGNPFEGRVEVFHNGSWGTVCDNRWTLREANVVCRQLGLDGASSAVEGGVFGEGSGKIWMDQVECFGNERRLSDCSYPGWEIHDCSHFEDAGVICMQGNKNMLHTILLTFSVFICFVFYTNITY